LCHLRKTYSNERSYLDFFLSGRRVPLTMTFAAVQLNQIQHSYDNFVGMHKKG
jgi:hypothetical protein